MFRFQHSAYFSIIHDTVYNISNSVFINTLFASDVFIILISKVKIYFTKTL